MWTRPAISTLLMVLAAAVATPGGAAGFEELDRLGLTNEDFGILTSAAEKLYQTGTPEVGAESEWQNPETGARGTVTVLEYDGRCVRLDHVFRGGKSAEAQEVVSRRCRGADGVWRLAE